MFICSDGFYDILRLVVICKVGLTTSPCIDQLVFNQWVNQKSSSTKGLTNPYQWVSESLSSTHGLTNLDQWVNKKLSSTNGLTNPDQWVSEKLSLTNGLTDFDP